jgi:hypothetical protein
VAAPPRSVRQAQIGRAPRPSSATTSATTLHQPRRKPHQKQSDQDQHHKTPQALQQHGGDAGLCGLGFLSRPLLVGDIAVYLGLEAISPLLLDT